MAAEDQEIVARFIADTAGFDAGAEDVIGKSQAIEASTSGMSKGMEEAGTAMSTFGGNAQKAGEGANTAAVGFKSMEESAGALSKDTEGAASGIAAVGDAGSKAAKGTEEAANGFVAAGKAAEESGKGAKAGAADMVAVSQALSEEDKAANSAVREFLGLDEATNKAGESSKKAAGGFNLMEGAMVAMMAIQFAQMLGQAIAALDQAQQAARNTEIAFTTLMHSEMNASQELAKLQNSAAADDFGKQKVADAAQYFLMLGKNADTTNLEIYKVSDALASVGKSGDQLIPAINDLHEIQKATLVTHDEIDKLAKDGVPAWDALANGMTNARGHLVTVAEAQKEVDAGAVHGSEAYKELMNGMTEYTGKAEQSSDTLAGKWQQLGESAQQAFGPAIEVLKRLLDIVKGVLDAVNALNDALHNIASSSPLVKNIMDAGYATVNPFSSFGSGFASGGTNLPSGWRMVGEDGPELQWSPGGDTIVPNGANPMSFLGLGGGAGGSLSLPSLSFGGGAPQVVELHIHMDSATIARQTIPLIAPQIRVLTGGRK